MLFMYHWLMNFSHFFFVDDWLMNFMNYWLVMLMNNLFVMFMNHLLMMLMNYIPLLFFYNWLSNVSLDFGRSHVLFDQGLAHMSLNHRLLLMPNHCGCLFELFLNNGLFGQTCLNIGTLRKKQVLVSAAE